MDEGEGGAAVRERILAGVDRLFYAQGIKSVGVDAIAAELGISKKTLYRHFPSKDDLVIAYLRGRVSASARSLHQTAGGADPGLSGVDRALPDQRQGLPRLRVSQRARRAR